jgi:hypothetical protein
LATRVAKASIFNGLVGEKRRSSNLDTIDSASRLMSSVFTVGRY